MRSCAPYEGLSSAVWEAAGSFSELIWENNCVYKLHGEIYKTELEPKNQMLYLQYVFCCFLVLHLFLRATTIMMVTIPTINTTTRAPTAPRMPPSRRGEGLVLDVTVGEPVKDTDVLMVPPAMVVVDITAVIDVGETAGLVNVGDRGSMYDGEDSTIYCVLLYLM